MSPPSSSVIGLPLPAEDCIVRDTTKVFAWFRPSNQPAKDAFHSVMESLISLGTAGAHCLKFMHATREAPRAVSVDSIDENLVEDEARVKPNKTWVGGYGLELENASLESSGWTVGAGCRGRQERKVDLLLTTETEQTSITSRHASLQFHPQSHQLRLMAHHTVSISGSGGYKRFKGEHRILRHDDMVELGSCTYRIEFALYETSAAYKEELRIFMADRVLGSTKLHPGLLAASNRQMMTIDNYTFLAGAFADGSFGDVSAGTDDKGDLVAVKRLKKAKKEKIEGHKALMNKIGFHKNVVQLIHVFTDADSPVPVTYCFYQPLGEGSLAEVKAKYNIDISAQLLMARGWAQGLDFLHGHGIIHRDIKASNLGIVLGHPPQGLIFDMDDALVAETSYDWRGGTLLYNAPEFNELRDEGADPNIDFHEELPPYDKHLDIWALGLSIWYMNDRLLIWYLHDPPEVRDRIASLPPHGQVLQNFVTKSRHAGYLKQLNNALENASAAGDGKLLGLLHLCKKMTKWYFLQRSDTEDVLEAVNQVITEFNITDGNIEPRRDEKQDVLPEKPPPQAAKRDLDALQDQSPNVQANVAAPAKRQHRAPKKGGPSKH